MSFRENELHRSQQTRRKHHKQQRRRKLREQHTQQKQYALDAPLSALHDDQVLTFLEWCRINRISERNGYRIIHAPGAPILTMLSPRRFGITIGNNRTWQASRARVSR
jgi:hypothetical protein